MNKNFVQHERFSPSWEEAAGIRQNGELIILNDIPADVCGQCWEFYLTADISQKVDHFLEEYRQHRPERYIPVPEFSAVHAMGLSV